MEKHTECAVWRLVGLLVFLSVAINGHETWPDGTYGLPKPITGCPNSQFTWAEGRRYHDTEDRFSNNQWSTFPLHLEGSWDRKNNMEQHFCMKKYSYQSGSSSRAWQPGSYCIFKYQNCPTGFQTGSLFWDDEDRLNANSFSGVLPDGNYDRNTRIYFCCREDGPTNQEIVLPTEDDFFLFPRYDQCQAVRGMIATKEWFRWDNEDLMNKDSATWYHPYEGVQGGDGNIVLHYCYYQRN